MKKKKKHNNFLTDYVKSVKKVMRETVGLQPTRVRQSVKAYNRNKTKHDTKQIINENI